MKNKKMDYKAIKVVFQHPMVLRSLHIRSDEKYFFYKGLK